MNYRAQTNLLLALTATSTLPAVSLSDLTGGNDNEENPSSSSATNNASTNLDLPGFSFDFASDQLQKAFSSAAPSTRKLVDSALASFSDGNDLAFLNDLGQLTAIDLTTSQQAALEAIKNDLLAAVLQRNFTFANTRDQEQVDKAITAIRSGNVSEATSTLGHMRESISLNSRQEKLLTGIIEGVPSVVQSPLDSLLPSSD